jgi:hypothetical protein
MKVVAVAEAVVTRSGGVRAKGRPCDHATLGTWLCCPGRSSGSRRRSGPGLTGARPSARNRCLELQQRVLAAAAAGHAERPDWSLTIGKSRPVAVHSADGPMLRVPDTPANRAAFGSVGTAGDSAAWPCVRLFPLNNAFTRSLLAMPWGAAGTDKTASEQRLLDAAMRDFPHVFSKDRVWLLDRLWHGVPRLKALAQLTHFAVRIKSDIIRRKVSEIYPHGTYLAEISGDGITMTVRVIEYDVHVEGQKIEEMFCLVTSLLEWEEYPGPELAAHYKWRWDGSETALREAKAPLRGAGPGTGPMLSSGSPLLIAQEIAAWACSVEMTRGVTRDAALTAAPARKGRRTGQPVRPRDLSLARARRLILAAIRAGNVGYHALTSRIAKYRVVTDRNRHRPRKSKSPSSFGHSGPQDRTTRIAPAVITMANAPA